MKWVAFFLLTFLAGIHGFAMFAPYAGFFLTLRAVIRRIQRNRMLKVVPITVSIAPADR